MSISDNVRRFREEKGLSVRALARLSAVSQPYLRQIELGAKNNPSAAVLQKLAVTLSVTVADLIGSPVEIPRGLVAKAPAALQELAKKKARVLGLRQDDVTMLAGIHYRGRQPSRMEDWELLFMFIRRLLE